MFLMKNRMSMWIFLVVSWILMIHIFPMSHVLELVVLVKRDVSLDVRKLIKVEEIVMSLARLVVRQVVRKDVFQDVSLLIRDLRSLPILLKMRIRTALFSVL